jgi:hypothetical protein
MGQPLVVACELCSSQANVEMCAHTDASGQRIEWPKATVNPDGLYFTIDCPNCGKRDQLMASPSDRQ